MFLVTIFTWIIFFFICSCNRHNIAGYWFLQQELNRLTSVQMKCRSYYVGAAWASLCICLYAFVVLVPENCHCLHSLVLCPHASMLTMNNTTNQSKWKDLIAIIRATFGCLCLWAVTVHHSCWTEGSVQAFKLASLYSCVGMLALHLTLGVLLLSPDSLLLWTSLCISRPICPELELENLVP
jgi:hypothetical protein